MPKRFLLVDDHELVRAGIRFMLKAAQPDCEVREASGFDDALAAMAVQVPDVVFLDIDLRSERNGLDLLAHLRSEGPACKVVMLSANDDTHLVMNCLAAGACGYIAKTSGDESAFSAALPIILAGGVYLPASLIHRVGAQRREGAAPGRAARLEALSPRLGEVLYHLCEGRSNKHIARELGISEGTVRKNYVTALFKHFGVRRRTELMVEVARQGLTLSPPRS